MADIERGIFPIPVPDPEVDSCVCEDEGGSDEDEVGDERYACARVFASMSG